MVDQKEILRWGATDGPSIIVPEQEGEGEGRRKDTRHGKLRRFERPPCTASPDDVRFRVRVKSLEKLEAGS
jgi:hypothetical protein